MRYAKNTRAVLIGILTAIAMISLALQPTMASVDIAKSTGKPCSACHTTAPALNDYGKKYKDSQKK